MQVVHRDIACRNILLNDDLIPKISDFGLARKVDVTAHYIVNKNVRIFRMLYFYVRILLVQNHMTRLERVY